MHMLSMILVVVTIALLICVASVAPKRSALSAFELKRREKVGNATAADELRREGLVDDILSLRRIVEAVLLILVVLFALRAFGPFLGFVASVCVAVIYPRIAASALASTWSAKRYHQYEPALLSFVERHERIFKNLRSVTRPSADTPLSSREELEHLVDSTGSLLSANEKKYILSGLHFKDKIVSDVMTPRTVVKTVAKDELIGPLMLDELHRTGFSRFPVIDQDIDHVVGILHIKELLTVGQRDSETAAEAMQKKVCYINQHQSLEHALAAFLKTRHHMFIVINGYRETVGLVTLEDVVETLLGREIVDEFDLHDDLRIVAERSAASNNNSPGSENV